MGDVRLLIKRLGIRSQAPQIESKALEYLRKANAILGRNALGQAEVCKSAVCVDLACTVLQVPVDSNSVALCSGVTKLAYLNSRATLQKALGVRTVASPRDLCIQFGCARHEAEVRSTLVSYKQRFLTALPELQREKVDFSRPVFLAAVFCLVARKNRVCVAKGRLLPSLGITPTEFNKTLASLTELMPEIVIEKEKKGSNKRKAAENKEGENIENVGNPDMLGSRGGISDCSENLERLKKDQLDEEKIRKNRKKGAPKLTESMLRQAVLA